MSKKKTPSFVQLNVKVEPALVARIDRQKDTVAARRGKSATRADVLRELILLGLGQLER